MLSERGITLLELVLVMVIVAMLAGLMSSMMLYEINTYTRITSRTERLQNAQRVLHLIARETRQIMAPDSIFYASADSFRFDILADIPISFNFMNNQILRNGRPMAKSVDSFIFAYFDDSGDPMANPVANLADIRTILLNLRTSINGRPFTVRVKVTPRNF